MSHDVQTSGVRSVFWVVVILLKSIVFFTEQALSRRLEIVSKDLFVLFRLHNPINQVQISDPMCSKATPNHYLIIMLDGTFHREGFISLIVKPPNLFFPIVPWLRTETRLSKEIFAIVRSSSAGDLYNIVPGLNDSWDL